MVHGLPARRHRRHFRTRERPAPEHRARLRQRTGRHDREGARRRARTAKAGCWGWRCPRTSPRDRYLYAYFTAASDNRIARLRLEERAGKLELGPPEVIFTGIPKASTHNGGRIRFGPDGYLYVGTGDSQRRGQPQDVNALGGKILRLTPEGRPAPGNPFGDNPVYSLGHRNVQGLAWDSAGRLWASEFGPDVDDELNLIVPGGNYGWPEVTGAPHRAGFLDAKVVWPSTAESSPSGLEIVGDTAYLGALRGQRLWVVPLNGEFAGDPVSYFTRTYGQDQERFAGPGRPPVGAQQQQKP